MPSLREHLKASRLLLGSSNAIVHRLMDEAAKRYPGRAHRTYGHDVEATELIGRLLGPEAQMEALLHLLQDWGWVTKKDYAFLGLKRPAPQTR